VIGHQIQKTRPGLVVSPNEISHHLKTLNHRSHDHDRPGLFNPHFKARPDRAAGGDGLAQKPFRLSEILQLMERHLGLRYQFAEAAPPPIAPPRLTAAALAELPAPALAEPRQAAQSLDSARVRRFIHQTSACHAALADSIASLAESYQL
jgi:hypothetical protein